MDFSSCDAILQARGVFFVFLIHRKCPGLRTRKSIRNTKTSLFGKCCSFFIRLRENTPLRDFLNLWKKRFSGSRVLKFRKIHDRFSFPDWGLILGGRLFSAIWGGNNSNFPPWVSKYGGEINQISPPGSRNMGGKFSPKSCFPPIMGGGERTPGVPLWFFEKHLWFFRA